MQYFSQSCCVWEIHSHVNVHEFYEKEIEVRVSEQCGLVAILFHHEKSFVMFCTSWQHEKWMIGFLKKWSDFLLWISAFKSLVLKFHNSYLLAHRANADFFFYSWEYKWERPWYMILFPCSRWLSFQGVPTIFLWFKERCVYMASELDDTFWGVKSLG